MKKIYLHRFFGMIAAVLVMFSGIATPVFGACYNDYSNDFSVEPGLEWNLQGALTDQNHASYDSVNQRLDITNFAAYATKKAILTLSEPNENDSLRVTFTYIPKVGHGRLKVFFYDGSGRIMNQDQIGCSNGNVRYETKSSNLIGDSSDVFTAEKPYRVEIKFDFSRRTIFYRFAKQQDTEGRWLFGEEYEKTVFSAEATANNALMQLNTIVFSNEYMDCNIAIDDVCVMNPPFATIAEIADAVYDNDNYTVTVTKECGVSQFLKKVVLTDHSAKVNVVTAENTELSPDAQLVGGTKLRITSLDNTKWIDYNISIAGRIEAESMALDGYFAKPLSFASGGKVISATTGSDSVWKTASLTFNGFDGDYSMIIGYLDVYNGSSTRKVLVNGKEIAVWAGNKTAGTSSFSMPQAIRTQDLKRKTISSVHLKNGDTVTLVGRNDYGEAGQFDYIEFAPAQEQSLEESVNSFSMPLDGAGFVKTWCSTGLVGTSLSELQTTEFADIVNSEPDFEIPNATSFSRELLNGMEFIPVSVGNNIYLQDTARGGEDQGFMTLDSYQCVDLIADGAMSVNACFYYQTGCYDVWLNGVKLKTVTWKYTPIQKAELSLDLMDGRNRIVVRSRSKANRAGQILIGLQLMNHTDKIVTTLPFDTETLTDFYRAEAWMSGFAADSAGSLHSQTPAFLPAAVRVGGTFYDWTPSSGEFNFSKQTGSVPTSFSAAVYIGDFSIAKDFENRSGLQFTKSDETNIEAYRKSYADKLYTAKKSESYCLGAEMTLKCLYGDSVSSSDKERILKELKSIDSFMDCSEFSFAHMLRFYILHSDKLDEETRSKFRDTILNFSYWSDELGGDTMIRTSENHQIGFYSCMLLAGQMFPDEVFTKSGRNGAQQAEIAEQRIDEWMKLIERDGYEEFQSGSYIGITLNAMLNIYDFAERDDIRARVGRLIDIIMEMSALNTFDGMSVGVQGRVYREVIAPETSVKQRIMSYFSPKMVQTEPTLWTVPLITSSYVISEELDTVIDGAAEREFIQGGTDVSLKKTKDYLITSVNIPASLPNSSPLASTYNKGAMLKQAHIWEASIGADARVFVNHPGTHIDSNNQRPDYWYGELCAPKVKMDGNTVMQIYNIAETSPVSFTHAYWPGDAFDETAAENHWLFARKGEGFVALWCSAPLVPHSDLLVGREYRANGLKTAWVCMVSSQEESGSFQQFIQNCKNRQPEFNSNQLVLNLDGQVVFGWDLVSVNLKKTVASVNLSDFDENESADYALILAKYVEQTLKDVQIVSTEAKDENYLLTASIQPQANQNCEWKAMFWDFSRMRPVCAAASRLIL